MLLGNSIKTTEVKLYHETLWPNDCSYVILNGQRLDMLFDKYHTLIHIHYKYRHSRYQGRQVLIPESRPKKLASASRQLWPQPRPAWPHGLVVFEVLCYVNT